VIVAINTRLLIREKIDGIGRFAFETLKIITQNNPEVEFHFIFDRPFTSDFIFSKNITPHVLSPPTRHPILWYIWFEFRVPNLLKKIKADIFFSPDGFIPLNCSIPTVTTIHDINFEHRPSDLPWSHRFFYRFFFRQYARLANRIVTVSNFSKKDISKTYQIDPEKIHVTYNGVSKIFKKISDDKKRIIKYKYSHNSDFFIFIGSLHKRKNIKNLLLSFEKYKQDKGKLKLLIVGERKWNNRATKDIYQNMKFKNEVIFLGRVKDKQLADILASAHALCFVSLFEGFGLPIIEAMQCGVPIITSNTSCMPEIAQDCAIIIDPYNISDITNAMLEISRNELKREELIQKADVRVKDFNWSSSAHKIWEIIKTCE
tara:strand:- start:253 stop:1371 length:1119 start_codon:yes stop_codon:yes gene_type:complete